jgi:hypothetical protein
MADSQNVVLERRIILTLTAIDVKVASSPPSSSIRSSELQFLDDGRDAR